MIYFNNSQTLCEIYIYTWNNEIAFLKLKSSSFPSNINYLFNFFMLLKTSHITAMYFDHIQSLLPILHSRSSWTSLLFPHPSPTSLPDFKKQPMESRCCCSYMHGYGATHWSIIDLTRATSLKKTGASSPGSHQQLPSYMWSDPWGVMILRPKLHCWLACFSPGKHNCYEFLNATTLSWTEDFILQSLSWPLAPIFPMFISFTMSSEQALIDSLNRMHPLVSSIWKFGPQLVVVLE